MSELQKFIFEGLPVRGAIVRLDDGWQAMQAVRAQSGAYPDAVTALLGEMTAAALLMKRTSSSMGRLFCKFRVTAP